VVICQQSQWHSKTSQSVAYTPMHLIVESLCGPYACYARLEQPHFGCVRPYYDVTFRKYSSVSLIMVLVSSTKLVSRKSSFDMSVYDASWRVPIGEPISNSI